MMNMSSLQRLIRQLSTLAVFACSFVKTIVDNNTLSHDKHIKIIETFSLLCSWSYQSF